MRPPQVSAAFDVDPKPLGVLDTALGMVTGILFGALLGIILFTEMGRRAAIRRRDAAALDDLEPLRDASR